MDVSVAPAEPPSVVAVGDQGCASSPETPSLQQPGLNDIVSLCLLPDELVYAAFKDLEAGMSRGELHARRSNFTGAWMLDRSAPHGAYRGALATWLVDWAERYFRRATKEASAMETISA